MRETGRLRNLEKRGRLGGRHHQRARPESAKRKVPIWKHDSTAIIASLLTTTTTNNNARIHCSPPSACPLPTASVRGTEPTVIAIALGGGGRCHGGAAGHVPAQNPGPDASSAYPARRRKTPRGHAAPALAQDLSQSSSDLARSLSVPPGPSGFGGSAARWTLIRLEHRLHRAWTLPLVLVLACWAGLAPSHPRWPCLAAGALPLLSAKRRQRATKSLHAASCRTRTAARSSPHAALSSARSVHPQDRSCNPAAKIESQPASVCPDCIEFMPASDLQRVAAVSPLQRPLTALALQWYFGTASLLRGCPKTLTIPRIYCTSWIWSHLLLRIGRYRFPIQPSRLLVADPPLPLELNARRFCRPRPLKGVCVINIPSMA